MSRLLSSFLRATIHGPITLRRTGRGSIRFMRRRLFAALVGGALAAFLALVGLAGAATPALTVSKGAAPLNGGLIYVSPAMRKEVSERDLQKVALTHPGYRLVVLARLPKGTETAETAGIAGLAKLKKASPPVKFVAVAHVPDQGTDLGGAMADGSVNQTEIQDAAKAALDAKQPSVVDTMKLFTDQVASGKTGSTTAGGSGGSGDGGSGFPWKWLVLLAVIGLGALLAPRMRAVSPDKRKRARGGSIATAPRRHTARLDNLSLRHSELVRAVGERPDDPALAEHHQT